MGIYTGFNIEFTVFFLGRPDFYITFITLLIINTKYFEKYV